MTVDELLRRVTAQGGRKALRYSAVSAIAVAVTQVLLLVLHGLLGWGPVGANVLAVSLAAVPAYVLNRAWVWGKRGRSHVRREVLPFWGFALAGLALSTAVVQVVADLWSAPLAVNAANIAAFGTLWVLKYLALDALVFGADDGAPVRVAETA